MTNHLELFDIHKKSKRSQSKPLGRNQLYFMNLYSNNGSNNNVRVTDVSHSDKNCSNNLVAICAPRCRTDRGGISNCEGLSKNSWHRCGLGWAAQRSTGWKAINDCCLFAYGLLFEFLSSPSPFFGCQAGYN